MFHRNFLDVSFTSSESQWCVTIMIYLLGGTVCLLITMNNRNSIRSPGRLLYEIDK